MDIARKNCKTTRNDKNFKSIQEENKVENHSEIQFKKQTMIHNAGIDAFMTGHVMLFLIGKISNFESVGTLDIQNINLQNFKDVHSFNFNINLSGKDFPLVIQKSNFHSISLQHREKKNSKDNQ
ncbi:target of EGR1 1-like [Brachionus plicatilis]|uniref:Target of EGR1 1-like n=1 Tax=Brachionus plicatilis TaxID=10195 RepID=A0A3M7S1K6_BRAPC|nr:target of EGR1 1-like [Brachionus plicatilis]